MVSNLVYIQYEYIDNGNKLTNIISLNNITTNQLSKLNNFDVNNYVNTYKLNENRDLILSIKLSKLNNFDVNYNCLEFNYTVLYCPTKKELYYSNNCIVYDNCIIDDNFIINFKHIKQNNYKLYMDHIINYFVFIMLILLASLIMFE